MPNECLYSMRVKGKTKNVDEFVHIIQADYNEVSKHFWRIFAADVCSEKEENGIKTVDITGDCAWSVHSCMRDGFGSYNNDFKTGKRNEKGTTLKEQSKLLNLEIEVYSSEPGMAFQEHYLYKDGEELENECVEYSEIYFEDEADFNKEKEQGFYKDYTWDDVNENGCLELGGFGEWIFHI